MLNVDFLSTFFQWDSEGTMQAKYGDVVPVDETLEYLSEFPQPEHALAGS